MKFTIFSQAVLAGALAGSCLLAPSRALACGGLFCSSPNLPVNQAAERIIFSENADGTVTAVIQIAYQGPAQKFSWLLPISGVPTAGQIGVGSNVAFQRLQAQTNPTYTLTTRFEGTCKVVQTPTAGGLGGTGGTASVNTGNPTNDAVRVEASGTVGAFDWTVISVDQSVADPATVAVKWLTDNGYSVGEGVPGLVRPYLQDGLNLLALRLTKGSDVGSIRPLKITYPADLPMIPIKLTAVAANNDMGVMAFVLGRARAVPKNYLALTLNEARINWFNASSNYGSVVNAAADEAGGQGFVTEFAAPSSSISTVVFGANDENNWQFVRTQTYSSPGALFLQAFNAWGQWDGFWDAARATVTLTGGTAFADFQACPSCYQDRVQLTPSAFFDAVDTGVLQPMRDMQTLIDSSAYTTRLYTTLSAAEMTVDPLFTFNSDLGNVSNLHTATRVIECQPSLTQFEAPWRIELPQGGAVRGAGSSTIWPSGLDGQPANTQITRVSESGSGVVVEDNGEAISHALADYNAAFPGAAGTGTGGSTGAAGSGNTGGLATTGGAMGGSRSLGGSPGAGGAAGSPGTGGDGDFVSAQGTGGCRMGRSGSMSLSAAAGLAALLLFKRRRGAPRR